MDENFLRFDVRQQYKKLKQAYQSNDSYASLPGDTSSLLNSRRSLPVIEPRKATGDSPYAIPGLPPDMQVTFQNIFNKRGQYSSFLLYLHHLFYSLLYQMKMTLSLSKCGSSTRL